MVDIIRSRLVVGAVSVAATETALPATAATGRISILVQNVGDADIYIGPTGVTTSTGIKIVAGASLPLDVGEKVVLYGICASGTVATRVLEGI